MLMSSRRAIREKTRKEIEKRKGTTSEEVKPVETKAVEPVVEAPKKEFIVAPTVIEHEGKKTTLTAPAVPAALQARHDKNMAAKNMPSKDVELEDDEEDSEGEKPEGLIREISEEERQRKRKQKKGN
jgi:hypothetical protein